MKGLIPFIMLQSKNEPRINKFKAFKIKDNDQHIQLKKSWRKKGIEIEENLKKEITNILR